MFLAHPEHWYYCVFLIVDFWRHFMVLLQVCPPIEMFPGGIWAHSPEFSWWFTLFEFLLVFQVLKVLPILWMIFPDPKVEVIGVRISRRRGGPWLVLESLLAIYNLWVLVFVYLNNFIWIVCGLCCTHKNFFFDFLYLYFWSLS